MWDTLPIIKTLQKKNNQLYEFVYQQCEVAKGYCNQINHIFNEYTDHSSKHSLNVLRYGNDIIMASEIELNEWEISCFILACYYHDIGMYCSQEKREQIMNSISFKREAAFLQNTIVTKEQLRTVQQEIIDKFIFIEYVRRRHAIFSKEWVLDKWKKSNPESFFNDDYYFWGIVADICVAHGSNISELVSPSYSIDDKRLQGATVNTLFLACLLRLSDCCDMDWTRAKPYLRAEMYFSSGKSEAIWKKLEFVDYVNCNSKAHAIQVGGEFSDYELQRAVVQECLWIDEELHSQIKHLGQLDSPYQYKLYYVDISGIHCSSDASYTDVMSGFKMNSEKVIELLMGSRLYRNRLFALRECLQNSIDSLQVYKNKYVDYSGEITIHFTHLEGTPIIDIFDDGTGMTEKIVKDHFLSIASDSFWKTESSYNEWGDLSKTSLIASHGIGVLSYFLLANKIEIYTKYIDKPPVNVLIDGYKDNAVFFKIPIAEFPSHNIEGRPNAWANHHGTLVRFYLENELDMEETVEFLATSILRPAFPVYAKFNNHPTIKLFNQWDFPHGESVNMSNIRWKVGIQEKMGGSKTPEDIIKYLFANDFYDNNPQDGSMCSMVTVPGITGRVYITPYEYQPMPSRITQNGILVEDAAAFIERFIPELFEDKKDTDLYPISNRSQKVGLFDLDFYGSDVFDLDAERTRIIDNGYNREIALKCRPLILDAYFNGIKNITNCLFFPCGNFWYHDISIASDDDQSQCYIAYHSTFNALYENFQQFECDVQHGLQGAWMQAKIYTVALVKGHEGISAFEIIDNPNYQLIVPKYVEGESDRYFGLDYDNCDLHMILDYSARSKVAPVFPPKYVDAFMVPLLSQTDLIIEHDDKYFVAYSLLTNPNNSFESNQKILFDAIGYNPSKKRW